MINRKRMQKGGKFWKSSRAWKAVASAKASNVQDRVDDRKVEIPVIFDPFFRRKNFPVLPDL